MRAVLREGQAMMIAVWFGGDGEDLFIRSDRMSRQWDLGVVRRAGVGSDVKVLRTDNAR
jgi:hypothetical protein